MEKTTCNNCNTDNQSNFRFCKNCGHELPKIKIIIDNEVNDNLTTKNKAKKSMISYVVGIIIFATTYFLVYQFYFNTSSYDKKMMEVANEINKVCPFMVDGETRLDNSIALPKNVFQYNYTLINMEKETTNIQEIESQLTPSIINFVKSNPDMKIQRDYNTTINYNYKDKNGVFLFKISVTPDLYK